MGPLTGENHVTMWGSKVNREKLLINLRSFLTHDNGHWARFDPIRAPIVKEYQK